MKLSSVRQSGFKEVILSLQALTQPLSGRPSFPRGFAHQPFGGGTSAMEERAQGCLGPKEQLQPVISPGLQVAHEFKEAEFAPVLLPQPGLQRWTERIGEQDEEHPAIEVTESADGGFSRESSQVEVTLPRLEDQFDVAVATHKSIPLVVQTRVYKLKRNMGQ